MLSTDQKILDAQTGAHARMLEYANIFDQLDILLVVKKFKVESLKLKVNEKLTIHQTSLWRALFWKPGFQISVVTAQDPFEIGFIGWRIARKLGVKLQLQIHTDFLSPYFTKFSLLNKIRVPIAKFLLPKADSIRVVSNRIKESLKTNNYKLKTDPIVLPVFVDLEKFKNAEVKVDLHKKYLQFEKIVLMASRLTKEKNIGLAIEAMQDVVKQNSKIGMIIVGEGPEKTKLVARSLEIGVTQNVIFELWTNDLPSYYKTADLFLNTSWYEGYGMTLVEAAVSGCPTVSTDVGIAREIGANIVGWSVAEVAHQILDSLQNPRKSILPHLSTKEEYLKEYSNSLSV